MTRLKLWWSIGRDNKRSAGGGSSGQILIMFALFLTVLMGALGLSIDLGMAFAERRAMQNAADAGAMAGAKIVSKASVSAAPVQGQVEDIVRDNAMDYGTIGTINCVYIGDGGGSLGSCANTIPVAATGVRVTVDESHDTFFIKVVPGAPNSVTTSATAAAHVKLISVVANGPFIPCGIGTKLAAGGEMDMLVQSNGAWVINEDAINEVFNIHGPKIEDCLVKPSEWKGLNNIPGNTGKDALGDWFKFETGTAAGTITEDVEGPNGCKAGVEANNCVAFLPIAIPQGQPLDSSDHRIWVVAYAPFYITQPKSNEHDGKLLSDYIVYGRGQNGDYGWSQNYTGPVSIRLTG